MPTITTAWLDDLQDNPDNFLIVDNADYGSGSLRRLNTDEFVNAFGGYNYDWLETVLGQGSGRHGQYRIQQVLFGEDPRVNADICAISHAFTGYTGGTHQWNADDSPDPTPPSCRDLPAPGSLADTAIAGTTARFITYQDPEPTGSAVDVDLYGTSYAMFFMAVRNNLQQRGVLQYPNPEDYGYPPDAVLEWEDEYVGLIKIEVTDSWHETGTAVYANHWYIDSAYAPEFDIPGYEGWSGPWRGGDLDAAGSLLSFTYADGDPVWHEIPDTEGWDGHGWLEEPSENSGIIIGPADHTAISWPDEPGVGEIFEGKNASPALRFVLQASRFRFTYEGEITTSVIRQYPRDDELGWGSGTRLYPPPKADRIIGGIQ